MSPRIDEKTMVPLGIVAALFSAGVGVSATGAFWVSKVDERLTRIEKKLDIARVPNGIIIPNAEAGQK